MTTRMIQEKGVCNGWKHLIPFLNLWKKVGESNKLFYYWSYYANDLHGFNYIIQEKNYTTKILLYELKMVWLSVSLHMGKVTRFEKIDDIYRFIDYRFKFNVMWIYNAYKFVLVQRISELVKFKMFLECTKKYELCLNNFYRLNKRIHWTSNYTLLHLDHRFQKKWCSCKKARCGN